MLTEISQIQEDKHHVFSRLPNVLNLNLAGGVGENSREIEVAVPGNRKLVRRRLEWR